MIHIQCVLFTEITDFNVLTFLPSSNLTLHTSFDLRGVLDLDSLNITFELPEGVAAVAGDRTWATFHRPQPSSTAIQESSTVNVPTVTPPVHAGKSTIHSRQLWNKIGGNCVLDAHFSYKDSRGTHCLGHKASS